MIPSENPELRQVAERQLARREAYAGSNFIVDADGGVYEFIVWASGGIWYDKFYPKSHKDWPRMSSYALAREGTLFKQPAPRTEPNRDDS